MVDAVKQREHDGSSLIVSEFLAIFLSFAYKLFYKIEVFVPKVPPRTSSILRKMQVTSSTNS